MSETSPGNKSSPGNELLRLLSALEDGTLAADEESRLAELLASDPEARTRYYRYVMLSALLRREGRRTAASRLTEPPAEADQQPVSQRARRRRAWLLAVAASALLLALLSIGEATGVTSFVPTIVRIVTGEGSLIIEVDDPSVSVQLDGDDVTIKGAGIHELRLRPGTHKFVATRNGQSVHDEVVVIERGGRQVVKVSRVPAAPASADLTSATSDSSVVPSSTSLHRLAHGQPVHDVAFAGPRRVLSGGWDHTVRLWDAEQGTEIHRFNFRLPGHNYAIFCVAATADGTRALAGSRDGRVWLLDLEAGRVLNHCDHPRSSERGGYGVNSIDLTANGGQALLGSYDGVVRIWDLPAWKEVGRLQHPFGLWSVDYGPADETALTAGGLGTEVTVSRWQLSDATRLMELPKGDDPAAGFWRVVHSPGGEWVAGACHDKNVHLWSASTGERVRTLPHGAVVAGVCFTPDGKRVVTGCYDTLARLWDVETGRELHRFVGHTGVVQSVAVSPDGQLVATAGLDGTLRVWQMPDP
jgi:WD40 repeat protein